jgi:hypothetical protein
MLVLFINIVNMFRSINVENNEAYASLTSVDQYCACTPARRKAVSSTWLSLNLLISLYEVLETRSNKMVAEIICGNATKITMGSTPAI